MTQVIMVSSGAIEFTWPVTIIEANGQDISQDAIKVSLGSYASPDVWLEPDADDAQEIKSQRVIQLLIGDVLRPEKGTYYLWSQVGDGPETVIRRHEIEIVIA